MRFVELYLPQGRGFYCSHCSRIELECFPTSCKTMWLDLNRIQRILVAHVCVHVCACVCVSASVTSRKRYAELVWGFLILLISFAWRLRLAKRNNCNCNRQQARGNGIANCFQLLATASGQLAGRRMTRRMAGQTDKLPAWLTEVALTGNINC